MNFKQLFGMRTLKTGIAVMASGALGMTPFIVSPFFTIVSTVLAMQNTVKNSFETGRNRILGTILGASLGFLFALLYMAIPLYVQPLILGLALMLSIILCNHFNLGSGLAITLTVCVSIIMGEDAGNLDLMAATIFRTTDTIIGILVSLGVNYFIKPPNYWGILSEEIEKIETIALGIFKNILVHQKFQLEGLRKEIAQLDKIYARISDDRKYQKNPLSATAIKSVVDACHEIYFHAKSIAKLERENPAMTLINEQDRIQIYRVFHSEETQVNIGDSCSIFEYHIYQILSHIKVLNLALDELQLKEN